MPLLDDTTSLAALHSDARALRAARACEDACRRLTHACMGVGRMIASDGVSSCIDAVMDASYTAAATARILAHVERHSLATIVSLVEICARLAGACADSCDLQRASETRVCAAAGRDCASACAALLATLQAQGPVTLSSARRSVL